MVLGRDDVHLHLLVGVHGLEDALGSGTGGGDHVLAGQVREVLVLGVFRLAVFCLGQQAGTDFEDTDREGDLLLALDVVGGRTTFDVNGAVLYQRDTGLGGDEVVFDLQVRLVQVLFQGLDDCQLDVMGVTDGFARSVGDVGERNGSVAVPQGNGARLVDLFQGAGQFGSEGWRTDQSGRNSGAQQMGNDTHQNFLDVVFFMEPLAGSFVQRTLQ
ncbi:hypothetical protein D3C79_714420 [compost metagenome]